MCRVIILGAGASAGFKNSESGVSPPVTSTFFDKAIELQNKQELNILEFAALSLFLKTYYRRTLKRACCLDVEEVLTMIDLANDEAARQNMLHLITTVLDKTLLGKQCDHHKQLWEKLGPNDTIINFNWDLILDNITAVLHGRLPEYGACPNVLRVGNGAMANDYREFPKPKVLKLHGSLNWMYCRTCNRTHAFMLKGKVGTYHFRGERRECPDCHSVTEPLIILPTLLKSYDYGVIQEVWSQARQALVQANEIIVVGYSLPATDFHAKWLFMKATAESDTKRLHVYDEVVNAEKKKDFAAKKDELLSKLASAFHVKKVGFTKGGIEEVANAIECRKPMTPIT